MKIHTWFKELMTELVRRRSNRVALNLTNLSRYSLRHLRIKPTPTPLADSPIPGVKVCDNAKPKTAGSTTGRSVSIRS
jgi:hypothetical protein